MRRIFIALCLILIATFCFGCFRRDVVKCFENREARLYFPNKVEFRVNGQTIAFDMHPEIELEWQEQDAVTIDAYTSSGGNRVATLYILGNIRLYNEAEQEIGGVVQLGLVIEPNAVKTVRHGETIRMPFYFDPGKVIERSGRYFAVAEFSGHLHGVPVKFRTPKTEFEVVQRIDHPETYPETVRRRWGILQ